MVEKRIPSVLKPYFDLFRFNIRENRRLPNELLSSQRSRFWTFGIYSLQSFDLFWCVSHILAVIHIVFASTFSSSLQTQRHRKSHVQENESTDKIISLHSTQDKRREETKTPLCPREGEKKKMVLLLYMMCS